MASLSWSIFQSDGAPLVVHVLFPVNRSVPISAGERPFIVEVLRSNIGFFVSANTHVGFTPSTQINGHTWLRWGHTRETRPLTTAPSLVFSPVAVVNRSCQSTSRPR